MGRYKDALFLADFGTLEYCPSDSFVPFFLSM